ncbi:MAG: hypothetical protein AB1721_00710 [Patescibacteria group bacterium]
MAFYSAEKDNELFIIGEVNWGNFQRMRAEAGYLLDELQNLIETLNLEPERKSALTFQAGQISGILLVLGAEDLDIKENELKKSMLKSARLLKDQFRIAKTNLPESEAVLSWLDKVVNFVSRLDDFIAENSGG